MLAASLLRAEMYRLVPSPEKADRLFWVSWRNTNS